MNENAAAAAETPAARFANRRVLITGASDKGIGGAIAERFAEDGARLELLSRSEPRRLLKRLQRREVSVEWRACDLTDAEQIRACVAACVEADPGLDVLINNAGVEVARPLDEFAHEDWTQMMDVNLRGAIEMTRCCLPHLRSPGGVIVNISSALSLGGCPGFSVYSASKAGLNGFTQSLAWELAPRKIRVTGVAPGLVHTPMIHKHIDQLTPEIWQQIESCHPLGMGMPQDVAAAATFLASDDARWITGVTVPLGWAPHYPLPTAQFL